MRLIYYSHSYREPDAGVVEFFGKLMRSERLTPSLDPPSDRLNSAKPERHLKNTDGMIAILTYRESGVSKYILYEISLCLRSNKPILVFVEDILPDDIIPRRILQRRFSRKGLLRQIRDLRYAIRIMKTYIGEEPPPHYQPSLQRRSCLITGIQELTPKAQKVIVKEVEENYYSPNILETESWSNIYDQNYQEIITCSDLSICFVDTKSSVSQFVVGALRAFLIPSILITSNYAYNFHPNVPLEYQPRIIEPNKISALRNIIKNEISIFEEEYVDLKDQTEVAHYTELLITESSPFGKYSDNIRKIFVKELVMGDKYSAGQGSVIIGPGAHAHHINFSQVWNQIGNEIDLNTLVEELGKLRKAMKESATEPEHDIAIGAVAEAESSAKKGKGNKILESLAKAGKWSFDLAIKIGATVAAAAIKSSLGL